MATLLSFHVKFCLDRALSRPSTTAYAVGTTFLKQFSCTTLISTPHPEAISTQSSEMRRSSTTPLSTGPPFHILGQPPKQHPHYVTIRDMSHMIDSNAPFARKFHREDPVLDKVDAELLFRGPRMIVPGGWCLCTRENGTDPWLVVGNVTALWPGPGAIRLERLVASLLSEGKFRPQICKMTMADLHVISG